MNNPIITNIKVRGMKGPDIDQECGPKMIFIGDNRTGKTSRTNAIHLALNGFISTAHHVSKKAGDIIDQYADGERLTCAITIAGSEFEYHVFRHESGKVSTRYRIDKAVYPKKEYFEELVKAGNPKIINLSDFIQMSENKKIDTLFRLFPSDVDISKLNKSIATKTAEKNSHQEKIKQKKSVIKENTKSKTDINLPAGTLAETRKLIEEIESEYRECRDKIAVAKAAIEEEKKDEPVKMNDLMGNGLGDQSHCDDIPFEPQHHNDDPDIMKETTSTMRELNRHPIDSLNRVLDIMEKSGCDICPAGMMCKKEIKTYESNE